MRLIFITLFLFGLTTCVIAQDDVPTNSFVLFYKKKIPSIHYQYDTAKQVNNYSNNWDFDKDGITDQVYFVGTGGAHLYFYLRIILSSDSVQQDFPFIESDFPVLPADYDLSKTGYKLSSNHTFFVVFKNDQQDNLAIFIKLDRVTLNVAKNSLRRKGIDTNLVTLSFIKNKAVFKDFIDRKHTIITNGSR